MSLRLIRAGQLSGDTAQTGGMTRAAAISGPLTGSQSLWMGTTVMAPATSSGDHHHGASETGIYVVSGHPAFVFRGAGDSGLTRLEAGPGASSGCRRTCRTARRTPRPIPRPSW